MIRVQSDQLQSLPVSRVDSLADLCLRLTRETFSPVTILVDRSLECLFYSGPTERYLRVPEGAPSHNLLAMIRKDLLAELQSALRQAWHQNRRLTVEGGRFLRHDGMVSLHIHLLPVDHGTEELMLVCFLEEPETETDRPVLAAFQPTLADAPPPVIEIYVEKLLELPVPSLVPVKTILLRPANSLALTRPAIFLVDKDDAARSAIRTLLEQDGHLVEDFVSCEAFLAARRPGQEGCLLIDPDLPGMTGQDLLLQLEETGRTLPTIMITAQSTVPMAVQAMKSGVSDFLGKPLNPAELLASLRRALEKSRDDSKVSAGRDDAVNRIAGLTARQHQIMGMVLAGHPNKNIAADLDISQRTVEHHRASIMEKTGSKSLPALARLALAAV